MKNLERALVVAGMCVGIGDDEILSACVMYQAFGGVELGKFHCDDRIARTKALDLFVHRNGFKVEFLGAVVLGDAFEAGNGLLLLAGAHVKVTKHIQGSEIVSVVIDDLPILLDS